jgi:uncharacterized GH25 family protein
MMKSLAMTVIVAGAAAAHFAWIAPAMPVLTVGAAVQVQLGIGHELGISESAPLVAGLEAYALAPSGARAELRPVKNGLWLNAEYTPKEAGQHRLVFTHDRGIRSRTPKGLVDGGRDKNPTATQAFRSVRTAVAYALTANAKFEPKAVGLVYELVPQRTEKGLTVTLLRNGKPCAGGAVAVSWAGKKEVVVGKTGADGKISYAVSAGAKGPLVLLAEQPVATAKGSNYDTDNYETAVYLNW